MRRQTAPTCALRPRINPLEGRSLLSGGIAWIQVAPASITVVVAPGGHAPSQAPAAPGPPSSASLTPGLGWSSAPRFEHGPGSWGDPFASTWGGASGLGTQGAPPALSPTSGTVQAGGPASGAAEAHDPRATAHGGDPDLGASSAPQSSAGDAPKPWSEGEAGRSHGTPDRSPPIFAPTPLPVGSLAFNAVVPATPTPRENAAGAQVLPAAAPASGHVSAQLGAEGRRMEPLTSVHAPADSRGAEPPRATRNAGPMGAASRTAPAPGAPAEGGTAADHDADDPEGDPREGLPPPHAAGLIAEAIPFDRASLERAVDRFLDQFEALGPGPLLEPGPVRLLPLSLAMLGTATAAEFARRRLRGGAGRGCAAEKRRPPVSEELGAFPELPGSWSTRWT